MGADLNVSENNELVKAKLMYNLLQNQTESLRAQITTIYKMI